jgi:cytoskeletal protein RodZ
MLNTLEMNVERETLGQYLKREREFRGISLEEIASVTRIPFRHLANIEADAFEDLPAQIFIKGYMRAYSHHIGLDSDQVILRYEAVLADKEAESEDHSTGYLSGLKRLFGRGEKLQASATRN